MLNLYHWGNYKLTPKGTYSVSCSYLAMLGTMTKMKEADLVWSSMMLPRQRVIVWLAYQDKLLTKERLQRQHVPVVDDCFCLCDDHVIETHCHLFASGFQKLEMH